MTIVQERAAMTRCGGQRYSLIPIMFSKTYYRGGTFVRNTNATLIRGMVVIETKEVA